MFATLAEQRAFEAGRQAGFAEWASLAEAVAEIAPHALIPHDGAIPTLPLLAERLALVEPGRLAILRPYNPAEAISPKEAAAVADRHPNTIAEWSDRYRIGRLVVGRLEISRPALLMLLDGDALALALLLSGRRDDPTVLPYLQRAGL